MKCDHNQCHLSFPLEKIIDSTNTLQFGQSHDILVIPLITIVIITQHQCGYLYSFNGK